MGNEQKELINKSDQKPEISEEREREFNEFLNQIKEVINEAPQAIEDEFLKDQNPWIFCFGTILFLLKKKIRSVEESGKISEECLMQINGKLVAVIEKGYKIKNGCGWDLPDELKKELLSDLQNIVV